MKRRYARSRAITGAALVLFTLVCASRPSLHAQSATSFETGFELVNSNGAIRKPSDYRDRFQMLGAYAVIDPEGNQLHYTYASPGAAEYYRSHNSFADGTVLVKEAFGTNHAQLTTGSANWAKDVKVWFVLVKDSKGRYPNSPLWGNGWGWALFKSDAPDRQAAVDFKKDCLGCHLPAKDTDWIYVEGYPALHSR